MKRKMTALRYLLGGILFLPAAYVLCGVTSLPFWAAVHFQSVLVLMIIVILGLFLTGAVIACSASSQTKDDTNAANVALIIAADISFLPWLCCALDFLVTEQFGLLFVTLILPFGGMIATGMLVDNAFADGVSGAWIPGLSLTLSLTLSGVLNFAYLTILSIMEEGNIFEEGGNLVEGLDDGVKLLAMIDLSVADRLDAFAALAGLVIFAFLAWLDYHKRLLDLCQYPEDRQFIARLALKHKNWHVCEAALNLLPYPEERESIARIALNDEAVYTVRKAALNLLPYPQERETIARIARNDKEEYIREAAVKRLPYPQEGEILVQIARNDKNEYVRKAALKRLPYPQERETIVWIAQNDERWNVRHAAVELLPYPQEREILERIVQNDERWDVREAAREKIEAWEKRTQGGAEITKGGGVF